MKKKLTEFEKLLHNLKKSRIMFLIRTSLRSPRSLNAVSVIQNCGMSSKDSIINDDFQEYSVISEAPDDNNLTQLASKRQKMENTFNKR